MSLLFWFPAKKRNHYINLVSIKCCLQKKQCEDHGWSLPCHFSGLVALYCHLVVKRETDDEYTFRLFRAGQKQHKAFWSVCGPKKKIFKFTLMDAIFMFITYSPSAVGGDQYLLIRLNLLDFPCSSLNVIELFRSSQVFTAFTRNYLCASSHVRWVTASVDRPSKFFVEFLRRAWNRERTKKKFDFS